MAPTSPKTEVTSGVACTAFVSNIAKYCHLGREPAVFSNNAGMPDEHQVKVFLVFVNEAHKLSDEDWSLSPRKYRSAT